MKKINYLKQETLKKHEKQQSVHTISQNNNKKMSQTVIQTLRHIEEEREGEDIFHDDKEQKMTRQRKRQTERVDAMRASLSQNESTRPFCTRVQYMKWGGGIVLKRCARCVICAGTAGISMHGMLRTCITGVRSLQAKLIFMSVSCVYYVHIRTLSSVLSTFSMQ